MLLYLYGLWLFYRGGEHTLDLDQSLGFYVEIESLVRVGYILPSNDPWILVASQMQHVQGIKVFK